MLQQHVSTGVLGIVIQETYQEFKIKNYGMPKEIKSKYNVLLLIIIIIIGRLHKFREG